MTKEFNISIKDFQIIKNASLSFLPGLNCIIGQSNNGKSAILRATKAAIYNIPGTTSVRLGCNNYAVGIQANGHTVIFQKGANSAYKIDGVPMSKIGRTQIQEVADALQIRELNLNGSNEEINFLDQMEKPFLLDRTETELFRFIVDSGKDSNVTLALKAITQDRQQITRDITTTEGKLELIESQIKEQEAKLKGSEAKLSLFQSVIDLGPKITRSKELSVLRTNLINQLVSLKGLREVNDNNTKLTEKIAPSIEKIGSAVKKQELLGLILNNVTKTNTELDQQKEKQAKLSKVDGTALIELVDKWKKIKEVSGEHFSIDKELAELKAKTYPEVSSDFDNKIKDYKTLSEILDNIKSYKSQLESQKLSLETTVEELEASQKEINDLGVCPMCGKPLHI